MPPPATHQLPPPHPSTAMLHPASSGLLQHPAYSSASLHPAASGCLPAMHQNGLSDHLPPPHNGPLPARDRFGAFPALAPLLLIQPLSDLFSSPRHLLCSKDEVVSWASVQGPHHIC
jgi:hypothetical protein